MTGADVHLRETDAFGWTLESDPVLRMTIVGVAVLDGTPDWDRFAARMDEVTRAVPMFRQRVVESPWHLAPPKWVVDPAFDLAWHLRRLRVAGPGDVAEVLPLAAQDAVSAFDLARPLWQATLVEGLEGERSALVLKLHHMLIDGVGGIQVMRRLFDVTQEGRPSEDLPAPRAVRTDGIRLVRDAVAFDVDRGRRLAQAGVSIAGRTAGAALHGPRAAVSGALATWRSVFEVLAPASAPLSTLMTARGLRRRYGTLDVPLSELRRAAAVVDGTVNDAFMTAVTGGMRRYHQRHDVPVHELRVVMPINLRRDGDPEGGNRLTLVRCVLPVGVADVAERMAETKRRSGHWKGAPALPYSEAISGVVNWLPAAYLHGLARHVDVVASNVPGLTQVVYLAGAPLLAFYPFGPTSGSAVNATLMSYGDMCHVAFNEDADAIPDGDDFLDCMRAGFDEVCRLAG